MTDDTQQFELSLIAPLDEDGVDPNRKTILKKIMDDRYLGTHETWQIFTHKNKNGITHYLGIREFCYDVDYTNVEKVSHYEAIWLIRNFNVNNFMQELKY